MDFNWYIHASKFLYQPLFLSLWASIHLRKMGILSSFAPVDLLYACVYHEYRRALGRS